MSIVPLKVLMQLTDVIPSDIYDNIEGISPAAGAETVIDMAGQYDGIGFNFDIINSGAVAGTATISINDARVITLAPGQSYNLQNYPWHRMRIRRAAAGAISVSVALTGFTYAMIREVTGWAA